MNLLTSRKSKWNPGAINPLVTLAHAQLRLSLNEQAQSSMGHGFGKWLQEVTPQWDWNPIHFRYSRWHLQKVTDGQIKRLLNFWPVRHGKPVSDDSLVLMGDGSRKPIRDVLVGDLVVTHTGGVQPVLAVHVQGELPCLKIVAESGRVTVAALSHPFLTTQGWKRADELAPGSVLANVPSPRCGGSDRPDEEFRLAGYFVGDGQTGYVGNGLSLAANVTCFDPVQAEDLVACADRMGFQVTQPEKYHGRYAFKGGVREWLKESGLAGKGSYQKRVPAWVFQGSRWQIGQYLGAYFACDGSINTSGKARDDGCVEFYSVNRDLLADTQHLLLRIGIRSRIRLKKGKYKGQPHHSWRLGITSQTDVARFTERVPMVSRKLATLKAWGYVPDRFEEPYQPDKVVSVEPVGDVACRCLEVAEDHTFTSDDFVVHNTEQNTIRYAAYRMELDPTIHIIVIAHTQTLATKISRKIKKIVQMRVPLARDKKSGPEWETEAGGSLRAMGVAGVGGGIGADLMILDDVIKNRKEANSPTYRDRIWDSFNDDIMTRLHPGAAVMATFTRWHEDDLAGRILESANADQWVVVRLPALAEDGDPLGRRPGAALWPSQWPASYLQARKEDMGDSFEAVYQQNPTPPGGKMFKRHWFSDVWPELPPGCKFIRYWDKAGTKGGDGAATAGVLMARTRDGDCIVCDVEWGRWEADEREKVIMSTARADGPLTTVWVEQEPGSGGKESAYNTVRNLIRAGYKAFSEPVHGDKTTRAEPMAAAAAVGVVKLLVDSHIKPWHKRFIQELTQFPQGKMKDQVDAASGAYNKLKLVPSPGTPIASQRPQGMHHHPQILVPRKELYLPGL